MALRCRASRKWQILEKSKYEWAQSKLETLVLQHHLPNAKFLKNIFQFERECFERIIMNMNGRAKSITIEKKSDVKYHWFMN